MVDRHQRTRAHMIRKGNNQAGATEQGYATVGKEPHYSGVERGVGSLDLGLLHSGRQAAHFLFLDPEGPLLRGALCLRDKELYVVTRSRVLDLLHERSIKHYLPTRIRAKDNTRTGCFLMFQDAENTNALALPASTGSQLKGPGTCLHHDIFLFFTGSAMGKVKLRIVWSSITVSRLISSSVRCDTGCGGTAGIGRGARGRGKVRSSWLSWCTKIKHKSRLLGTASGGLTCGPCLAPEKSGKWL